MIYIFDTSALMHLFRHYYKDRFPSLWEAFDDEVDNGNIISVREAYNEITQGAEKDELLEWAEINKDKVFLQPTSEETDFLRVIFANAHYRQLISEKAILEGSFQADPFVIAAAKIKNACAVTLDGFNPNGKVKPHAPKIAFICQSLGVDCCNFEQFMAKANWQF